MDKPWFASVTVWGGIIAVLAGILGPIGYSIAPEDQQQLAGILAAAASAVAGFLAVIGRIRAGRAAKADTARTAQPRTAPLIALCLCLLLASQACMYGPGVQTDPEKIAAAEQWLTASEVALGMASTAVCIFCPSLCPAAEATRGLLRVAIETFRAQPTEETWAQARRLVSELRQTTDGCESAQVAGR